MNICNTWEHVLQIIHCKDTAIDICTKIGLHHLVWSMQDSHMTAVVHRCWIPMAKPSPVVFPVSAERQSRSNISRSVSVENMLFDPSLKSEAQQAIILKDLPVA